MRLVLTSTKLKSLVMVVRKRLFIFHMKCLPISRPFNYQWTCFISTTNCTQKAMCTKSFAVWVTVLSPVLSKVSFTGPGRLRECKSTEFFWELRKPGFCEGGRKWSGPLGTTRASTLKQFSFLCNNNYAACNKGSATSLCLPKATKIATLT